jgi:hypothetical protein
VLLAVVIAAGVWLYNTDLGRFRVQLEQVLAARLGRTVTLEQSLSIRLGSEIRIQARGLRLANPDWAGQPDALYVERLDVSVLASSLWRPPLVITSLEAGGLRLWLETSDAGVSNFSFSPDAQPSTSDRDGRVLPVFQHIALQDLRLDWLQAGHDQPQTLIVSTLAQELLADNMLELALQGLANSQPLAFNGILGPFDALLQGRNVALKGSGQLGGLAVQGHALIDDLTAPRYPEFDLQVRGADFAPLAALLGRPAPGEGPYPLQVSGQRIDDRLQLQLSGDIGSLSVTAEGHNAGVADFSQLDFAVAARQPRFPAWQDSQATRQDAMARVPSRNLAIHAVTRYRTNRQYAGEFAMTRRVAGGGAPRLLD